MFKKLLILCFVAAFVNAGFFPIDDFTTSQNLLRIDSNNNPTNFGFVTDSSILGGERELFMEGDFTSSCEPNAGVGSLGLAVQNGVDCAARVTVTYDGVEGLTDNQQGVTPTDFLSCMDTFEIQASSDQPTTVYVKFYTGSTNAVCVVAQNIVGDSVVRTFTFARGTITGGCDLNDISSIELVAGVDGNEDPLLNVDVTIAAVGYSCPDTADLRGRVFSDCECDEVQGLADEGIQGVTVDLSGTGCAAASTTTDALGNYAFTAIEACTYTVTVNNVDACNGNDVQTVNFLAQDITDVNFAVVAEGPSITAPGTCSVQCNEDTGVSSCGDAQSFTGTPTFSDSSVSTNCAAGFAECFERTFCVTNDCGEACDIQIIQIEPCTADIEGHVFSDCECDNSQGANDDDLQGIVVTLGGAGCTSDTTTTDINGDYRFADVLPCTYTVTVDADACSGFATQTVVMNADDVTDVDFPIVSPPPVIDTPATCSVACGDSTGVLVCGEAACNEGDATFVDGTSSTNCAAGFDECFTRTWTCGNDCGEITGVQTIQIEPCTANIQGHVFDDCNCGGTQDATEDDRVGMMVTLGGTGCDTDTTFTDENGDYEFTSVLPCTYTISVNGACDGDETVTVNAVDVTGIDFGVLVEGPTISAPADCVVPCDGDDQPSECGNPTVGNTDETATFVDGAMEAVCDTDACAESRSFIRTWTVSNECGTVTDTQLISFPPCACPPVVTCPPPVVCPPPTTTCPPVVTCPPPVVCPPTTTCPVCPPTTTCPPTTICPPTTTCPVCPVVTCPAPTTCPVVTCPPPTVCPVCPGSPLSPTPFSPSPSTPSPNTPSPNSPAPSPDSPSPNSPSPNTPSPNSPTPPSPSCRTVCSSSSSDATSLNGSILIAIIATVFAIFNFF